MCHNLAHRENKANQLIGDYLDLSDENSDFDDLQFLRDHPEFAKELTEFFVLDLLVGMIFKFCDEESDEQ